MKKLIVFIFAISVAFVSCKNEKAKKDISSEKTENQELTFEDGTYNANVEKSTLTWKGFKPTGTHNGTVAIKEGSLELKEGKLVSGKFTFDMATITVLDIPADDEFNGKLVGHLKSGDFFDVENNPTSTFEITDVASAENGLTVKGDLTVKGITKAIEFTANLVATENGIELSSESFKIDRTEFDIKYKSTKFFDNLKDKFINDDFEIGFKVNASK